MLEVQGDAILLWGVSKCTPSQFVDRAELTCFHLQKDWVRHKQLCKLFIHAMKTDLDVRTDRDFAANLVLRLIQLLDQRGRSVEIARAS